MATLELQQPNTITDGGALSTVSSYASKVVAIRPLSPGDASEIRAIPAVMPARPYTEFSPQVPNVSMTPMTPFVMSPGQADREVPLEQTFYALVGQWLSALGPTSDYSQLVSHPAYRRIVGLGRAAVPLLLHEIEQQPSLLVWALHEITGENPVPKRFEGRIDQMSQAWIRWAKKQKPV